MRHDSAGRPEPVNLACPKCDYRHCYVWGPAPDKQARPNGGCPICKHLWNLTTGERINPPS